jgi:hypothetical protein
MGLRHEAHTEGFYEGVGFVIRLVQLLSLNRSCFLEGFTRFLAYMILASSDAAFDGQ